jgi:hypothetical protein
MLWIFLLLFCGNLFAQDNPPPPLPNPGNMPKEEAQAPELTLPPIIDDINKKADKNKKSQDPPKKEEFVKTESSEDELLHPNVEGIIDVTDEGFFDKIGGITQKIRKALFTSNPKPKQVVQPKKPPKKAPIPEDNSYPKPFFEDVSYEKNTSEIPMWIYEYKMNGQNKHLPLPDTEKEYAIYYNIFQLVRIPSKYDELVKYVQASTELNHSDKFGNTPLLYAIRYQNNPAVKLLLYSHADPNICNNAGICPIHLVSFIGDMELFRVLLQNNADYSKKDNNQIDALLYSLYGGNMEIFTLLFNRDEYAKKINLNDLDVLIRLAFNSENMRIYRYLVDFRKTNFPNN